ncbi:MAG: DUF624 domain-containing protein [Bacillota bacterium]|nr:DUF624 domain-containing protein [Bacillota bacterium]
MSFLSPNYCTPGPGVPEGEPQKPGIIRYFIVAGRKFWNLTIINIYYMLFSLIGIAAYTLIGWCFFGGIASGLAKEIIAQGSLKSSPEEFTAYVLLLLSLFFGLIMTSLLGSGSPTAGLTYILRNYSREEHAFIWADFYEKFKSNFFKGLKVFLIDLIFVYVICLDIYVYSQTGGGFKGLAATYLAIFIFLIYIMMHPYIYTIMVTFDMKITQIYKNAFMMAAAKVLQNLACLIAGLAIMILIIEIVYRFNVMMLLIFFMFFTFSNLVFIMNSFSVVKKYMIKENENTAEN